MRCDVVWLGREQITYILPVTADNYATYHIIRYNNTIPDLLVTPHQMTPDGHGRRPLSPLERSGSLQIAHHEGQSWSQSRSVTVLDRDCCGSDRYVIDMLFVVIIRYAVQHNTIQYNNKPHTQYTKTEITKSNSLFNKFIDLTDLSATVFWAPIEFRGIL